MCAILHWSFYRRRLVVDLKRHFDELNSTCIRTNLVSDFILYELKQCLDLALMSVIEPKSFYFSSHPLCCMHFNNIHTIFSIDFSHSFLFEFYFYLERTTDKIVRRIKDCVLRG